LLRANRADIKVMQELLRHASSRVTMDTYTQAVTSQKRKERPIHDFTGLTRGGRPLSRWKSPGSESKTVA
jgi:hypothetical protein